MLKGAVILFAKTNIFWSHAMAAEHFSASLVSRSSVKGNLQTPHGYYRSKLFTAPFTTNPLVAAAGPILSLLERLYSSPTLPPVNSIRENIEHELRAFQSRIQEKNSASELEAIAEYLLCATIDELLGKSYLRLYGQPAEFTAFTPASHNGVGPEERFFDIVDFIKERPNQYLDLIELTYYCLICGFEGKQHGRADGRLILDNLIEELYQLIQQYRVNKSLNLFKEPKKTEPQPPDRKPVLTICLISLSLLVAGYFISDFLIENKAKRVQFGHRLMTRLDN